VRIPHREQEPRVTGVLLAGTAKGHNPVINCNWGTGFSPAEVEVFIL
jgi:hypothetical protein